jgi:acyl carrier protein
MTALREFFARLLWPSDRRVAPVPATSEAEAAAWAARHYSDEKRRALAARFALILEAQINRPLREFAPTSRFMEDLEMHDLEPVEVLLAIEQEFQIKVPAETAAAMTIFDDVVRYLAARP